MVKQKKYNSLRLKLGKWKLKRFLKANPRQTTVCSLANAKTIGISFAVNNHEELERIRKILRRLSERNIQTFALGYLPVKKPNDFYLSQKSFNFFSDSDLNFSLVPDNVAVKEFVDTKFDILIDFATEDYFPMDYVLNVSKASFKVGWFGNNQPFDLMLNIDKNAGVEYYFDQVLHYLDKIK